MLNEQTVNINFSQGLNTKTDPWQLPVGQFLSLQNSIFQKGGLLSKRNGYGLLPGVPPTSSYLTTLNNSLIAIGDTISAYSPSTSSWISKGNLQPVSLSVQPVIRNNLNQIQTDSVISNDFICITYTQTTATVSGPVNNYLYAIENRTTGQNIVQATAIPVLSGGTISGSSRVFIVGRFFVIVSPVLITGTTFLQYTSIPIISPLTISAAQNTFAEAYIPLSDNPGWDGAVTNNTLVLAYNTTAGGQGIHVISLTEQQIASNTATTTIHSFVNATYKAGVLSVCCDLTVSPNIVYISFWNPTTTNGYTCAVYIGFGTITTQFTPQQIITTMAIGNIASCAQNSSCVVYSEVVNAYSYDSSVPTNYITAVTVSSIGVVGSPYTVIRSVGLASKAFIVNGVNYFLSAFQSPFQPSYFLINASISVQADPIIVAKIAYQNGGGYLSFGLPSVTVYGDIADVSYLFKQDVEALNTVSNTQQTSVGGIYSQLGINLVSFNLGTMSISAVELAQDLQFSGGFLGMFDGYYPVEQNFFVFPDSVECTYTAVSTVTPTGTFSSGSKTVVVSSATGISPGMSISDTTNAAYIPTGTVVVYVNGTTLTISKATTNAGAGDTLSIQGNIAAKPDGITNAQAYFYQATYEWTDMQGNAHKSQPSIPVSVTTTGTGTTGTIAVSVPTLRLTYKIKNPVKIVIYRWSAETEVYNQVTSINAPVLNDTTADSVTFVDTLPDSSVVGNNIIYTTGGVVPNTNGPASDIVTIFDTRLWVIDAENRNQIWISKTVVQGAPVEMSSLFTVFIAPNEDASGSSGDITAAAPMDDKIIIFKNNSIFYINGTGPDNLGTTQQGCPLGSYSQPTFITSVAGCINQKSIVLTQDGLMFQSNKGIWLVNRQLQTTYIGAPVEAYNSSTVTSASVIPETNYVLFTLNTGEMLMYDYYYEQWGIFVGVPGTSSCVYNGLHTVLDKYGEILQETPGKYLDRSNPVVMQFTTSWINLASLQGYERIYEFYILAKYITPHTLNVQVAYNYNPSTYHRTPILPDNFSPSTPSSFGIPTPVGSPTQLEQWRVHTKQQLCQSFQLSIQEVFDPSMGTLAGAGLTVSGLNCKVGIKKSRRPIRAANTVG